MGKTRWLSALAAGVLFWASVNPMAAAAETLSLQERYSRGLLDYLDAPQYIWLEEGRVLLLDPRVEESRRTLEYFDPRTGERTPVADREQFLAALGRASGGESPASIRWPDALDRSGTRAVYIEGGDLYLLELDGVSVRRLTKTPQPESGVSFSPDGKWVAFIRDNDLFVLDGESGAEKRLTSGATDTLLNGPLSWVYWEEIYDHTDVPYQWSPDSNAIAYLQTDDSPVSVSTFVNFRPATQEAVRQRYPKAGQANPRVRLGVVELVSAHTRWLDCGNYEYLVRFDWLRDGETVAVQTQNRRQSELRLFFADRKTGTSRLVLMETHPAWININNCLYFLKDGRRFIWCSERDGYRHLYLYDLEGRLQAQLTQGEFMVVGSGSRFLGVNHDGLCGVDEARGLVYFTSNQDSLRDRQLYRVRLDGTGGVRISVGAGVHAVGFSPNLGLFLDVYSNASTPPELTLREPSGNLRRNASGRARGKTDF